jgi:dolichol-phosphate mannosyltransferase
MPVLSVVMPAYNEERTIARAMAEVVEHVLSAECDAELIVVDDGSRDRTAGIVQDHQARHAGIRLIKQANAGHGAALRRGIDAATGEWLLLLDSDCQIGLRDFGSHWAMRDSYDALLGVRKPRRDPRLRLVISFLMKAALRLYVGVAPQDANAPYKIVSRSAWNGSKPMISEQSLIPSLLLATSLLRNGDMRVRQVPVVHQERTEGVSTLNARRLWRFCRSAFAEIRNFGKAARSTAFSTGAHESTD